MTVIADRGDRREFEAALRPRCEDDLADVEPDDDERLEPDKKACIMNLPVLPVPVPVPVPVP